MTRAWQLQEAKNKLSEVVESAVAEGPQRITKHGKDAVVVVSVEDYERLRRGKDTLAVFLRRAPLRGLDLDRARDLPRTVDL